MSERSLLIEGWRGINHSYALANQYQLLEMLGLPGLRLFHHDLPFAFPHWNRQDHGSGLSSVEQSRVDAIPAAKGAPVDGVFRICAPFRSASPGDLRPTTTFMITELGLTRASFDAMARPDEFTRNLNRIVTSTAWSRDRIVEWGFAPDRIDVVPLGVDRQAFHPLTQAERQASRAALGVEDDETLLLNVGIPAWNKGIDVLLRAFTTLCQAGRRVRLIVKDQRDVYGVTLDQVIANMSATCPGLVEAGTLQRLLLVKGGMGREGLRLLYGAADAYVSPYRAEGFNLPVLEAIACGTPAIVTAGGATDAFCPGAVATRIPGRFCSREQDGGVGRYIEPDLAALTEAIDAVISREVDRAAHEAALPSLLAGFTWAATARRIVELTIGGTIERAAPALAA